jgi:type VI secretion system protein ImpE
MTPVERAEQALREADVDAALKSLQDGVRAQPANPKLRVFLFQLLCVTGQWSRALNQLEVCGELDAGTLTMVSTYREALKCESLREAVFEGRTTPVVFGQPQPWVALLVEALRCDALDNSAGAARLRQEAFDAAPATAGTLDGQPFEWIADADSRLGPVLEAVINGRYCWVPFTALAGLSIEAPTDLRDLVWSAAHLTFANGGDTVALIPTRYPGSAASTDGAVRLARRTDWEPLGVGSAGDAGVAGAERDAGHFRGLGQRVLATSSGDVDLLQVRQIVLQNEDAAAEGTGAADAAGGVRAAPDAAPPTSS